MELNTGKKHRKPAVPLPEGFATRLKRLQRELLRDLQWEKTWRRRFRNYYDVELHDILGHLNAARVTSALNEFYRILNKNPGAREELLIEANSWGVNPADPDERSCALYAPIATPSGDPVGKEPLPETEWDLEGVQLSEPKENSAMTKKMKADEQNVAKALEENQVVWVKEGAVEGEHGSTGQTGLQKTLGEYGRRETVRQAENRGLLAKADPEDVEIELGENLQEEDAGPKQVKRQLRKSAVGPLEATVFHVQRASQPRAYWNGTHEEDLDELGNLTVENNEKEGKIEGGKGGDDGGMETTSDPDPEKVESEEEEESEVLRDVGKKTPGSTKSKPAESSKACKHEVTIQHGILSRSITRQQSKEGRSRQAVDDAEVHVEAVAKATEFAKNHPDKVRLMEGEERCLTCKEGSLNCWKSTGGSSKTCSICHYAHKHCAWVSDGAAESRPNPAIDLDVRRAELLGLETILAAALGLDNMDVDELKLNIAVGEDDEEKDVEVSFSVMVASLAPGIPILVYQVVHLREEQERLRQKVERLENLVESHLDLLQEEMRGSTRRAEEVRRYHCEAQVKMDRLEDLLQQLVARGGRESIQSPASMSGSSRPPPTLDRLGTSCTGLGNEH